MMIKPKSVILLLGYCCARRSAVYDAIFRVSILINVDRRGSSRFDNITDYHIALK